jgi:NAD-dependent histone deacetylase SIR2
LYITNLTLVPDFRSSTGLFTTLRGKHKLKASGKHLFDASVYKSDSSTSSFHDMIRELSHQTRNAQPTLFHHMLATLSEEGRLLRLYTQNVDGIDTSLAPLATDVPLNMKGPWPKTIQLHGGLGKMVCTKCHELSDFDGQLFEGPEPPSCKSCEELEQTRIQFGKKRSHGVGRLRPRMVLYNEFNPEEDAIGAVARNDLQKRPDAVIVVGTSLKIPGVRRMVREMCAVTRGRRDGFTAFINNGPEPIANEFKDSWDLVVRGDCQDVARYAALPKWNDKDIGNYSDVSEEDMVKATSKAKVEVILEAKHKVVEKTQGMLTPMASPRHQSPVPMKSGITIKIPKFTPDGASGKVAGSKISKSTTKAATKKKPSKKATTAKPLNKITLNKITNVFSVTKTTTLSEKSAKVPAVRSTAPEVLDIKPPTTPMGPLSPCEVRNNTDLSSHSQHDHDSSLLRDQLLSDVAKSISPVQNRRETISPKGKLPSNMEHLIDVDESLS